MRILTVCVGNVCRSPLAERLLQRGLDEAAGAGLATVSSAGTRARDGMEMSGESAADLVRLGGDPEGFRSRRLIPSTVAEADLVIAMTRDIRTATIREQPRAMKRTFTLGELAAACGSLPDQGGPSSVQELVGWVSSQRQRFAEQDDDIPDPIGKPPEVYRAVAETIRAHTEVVVAALAPLLVP